MEAVPVVTKPKVAVETPLFCARCTAELEPGVGDFFQVTIEAIADPTPPTVANEDLQTDLRGRIERLLAQMEGVSAQEAMDQVYRRLVIHLCGPCYHQWIENPTGGPEKP
jgi:hypothetical protein